ncbi:hypothetical protein FHN55_00625 [Streptomyces sp. NP160]|uniref:hypothetical protein n=1 Tax=Streptomyces sp. NP160 TaxID=2586637 RepID=UPI001117EA12|nr:hypothetical protein [Streptomyces sp. NP160]TNM70229.1 hypothetical protein FHN55_00625 [Streptomyces sp. NP160]
MTTPDRGALRAVRSAVLALFVVGLSATGHAAAGGHLPGAAAGTGLTAAVVVCCVLATRWRLPVGAAVPLLAGSQVVLHAALESLAPAHRLAPPGPGAAALGEHAGHLAQAGHAVATAASTTSTTSTTSMTSVAPALWLGGPSAADATMLLAHVAVAAALALVYSRGEDAVWALCAWLAPLAVVVALVALPAAPRLRARPDGALAVVGRVVLRAVRRRGPPLVAAG